MEDTMNQIDRLPFEILVQILRELSLTIQSDKQCDLNTSVASDSHHETPSYTELIDLRLVSKTWSKALMSFCFETISIDSSQRATSIIEHWNEDLFRPHFYCPVKTLVVEGLWYHKEEVEGNQVKETCLGILKRRPALVSVDQVARLIELLGKNLKTLKLWYYKYAGVSPRLIEACKNIQGLKSLQLSVHKRPDLKYSDLDSVSKFLSAIPQLESLDSFSVFFDSSKLIELEAPALMNLRNFRFLLFDANCEVMSLFIETAKNTLKTIDLVSALDANEGLEDIFYPVKDTLEGLFTLSFTEHIIGEITNWNFPNLRVISTSYTPEWLCQELHWLQVPMLKGVRTLVTRLEGGEDYWLNALICIGVDASKKVPNLKHIVFTRDKESETQAIDPELIEILKSHGIQCHLIHELTADEIMELDYKLNGPMD